MHHTEFEYRGRKYRFDAQACYDGLSLVRLPDGKVLRVIGWLESSPPQPAGVEDAGYLPGFEPDGATRAELVD